MKKIITWATLCLMGCCNNKGRYPTYLEAVNNGKARHHVGEVMVVDEGEWAGCHLEITQITAEEHICGVLSIHNCFLTVYKGISEDCPINVVR